MTPTYTCPGRDLSEPEGWVACYRAGHPCPPKVAVREVTETHVITTHRCPCCGDFGGSYGIPLDWHAAFDHGRMDTAMREAGA